MADIVLMPKMNLEMIAGFIGKWNIAEGGVVQKEDVLCEVENEKEVAPVHSSYEGILVKYLYAEGESCPVGKPLCIIAAEGEDWAEAYQKAQDLRNATKEGFTIDKVIVKGGAGAGSGKISPKIRKLLRDHDIAQEDIEAAFPDCRITEKEIDAYLAGKTSAPAVAADDGDTRQRMTPMRDAISRAMTQSCQKTARLTNFLEVDMTGVAERVKAAKERGTKLSYTAIVIKACAKAVADNPIVNTVLDETANEIVFKKGVHIGCAVDSTAGLVVPVVRDADRKSCLEITQELRQLADKVHARTLTSEERSGGTFTVSSIGMYDADYFTPIINYPQTAILGVGRIQVVPRYTDDTYTTVAPKHVMEIGLTYDHRVIDGGPAMRFMLAVRDVLQNDADLF